MICNSYTDTHYEIHFVDLLPAIYVFFFNDTATTEIYTLSLHDALPIYQVAACRAHRAIRRAGGAAGEIRLHGVPRRRSEEHTSELQSQSISYAVFCLKKKKNKPSHLESRPRAHSASHDM